MMETEMVVGDKPKTTQLKCGFCNAQPLPLGMTIMKVGDPRAGSFICHIFFCGHCQAIINANTVGQEEALIQTAGQVPAGRLS